MTKLWQHHSVIRIARRLSEAFDSPGDECHRKELLQSPAEDDYPDTNEEVLELAHIYAAGELWSYCNSGFLSPDMSSKWVAGMSISTGSGEIMTGVRIVAKFMSTTSPAAAR